MGKIRSIHVAVEAGGPMRALEVVRAVPGRGLEGDRYFAGTGSYSQRPGSGREVTLIEEETLEAVRRELQLELAPGETRRNLVTQGVALNPLVDREFTVGEVRLRGTRLCEPCKELTVVTGKPGLLPGLVHRGGLRCVILNEGVIRVGDEVSPGDGDA